VGGSSGITKRNSRNSAFGRLSSPLSNQSVCPPGYHWDDIAQTCEPDPSPMTLFPSGMITYRTYDDAGFIPLDAPVKYIKIVVRRYFKIAKTHTDANGNFQLSRRFPRKVTIVVRFKLSTSHGGHVVRKERKHLWKKNIGTYKGKNLNNRHYVFLRGAVTNEKRTSRWVGCIALNAHIETDNFIASNNLVAIQNVTKFVTNPDHGGIATDYVFDQHVNIQDELTNRIWIAYQCTNINSLTASKVTMNVAQQLGVLHLANITGADNYSNMYHEYHNNSIYYVALYMPNDAPFGNGISINAYTADVVAMWQAYAQHISHMIADKIYGWSEYNFILQGKNWISSGGISGSAKFLEQSDPSIGPPSEKFPWIPRGIINDLMDNTSDPSPVIDNVSGFTYGEIQAAFDTEPGHMIDFKNALKAIKPNQSSAIDQFFTSYGW
jgi:hypothetical protein